MKHWPTSTSSMPAIAALALLVWNGSTIMWLPCLATVAAIILIHTLVNRFCGCKCADDPKTPFIIKSLINWVLFIILPTVLVSYAAIGAVQWIVLLATLPVGLLSDTALNSNIKPETKWQAYFFNIEMLLPFIWTGVLSMCSLLPVSTIIIFLSIPMAIGYAKRPLDSHAGDKIIVEDLHEKTVYFQITFTILFVVSLIIDKLF